MLRKVRFFTVDMVWSTPAFWLMTVLFVCGTIAGGGAGLLGQETAQAAQLSRYLVQGAPLAQQLLGAILSALLWPIACLTGGRLSPPSLFVGAIVAARGFFLSFTVASMAKQLGLRGVLLSLAATGASALVTVPCLLLVAGVALAAAGSAPRGQRGGYFYALRRYRGSLAVCLVLSLIAVVLRSVFAPFLLHNLG